MSAPAAQDQEFYNHAEMMEAAGITYRQLDHWTRMEYLTAYGRGSGTARSWPASEVEVARRMGRLAAAGLTPMAAAFLARIDPAGTPVVLPSGVAIVGDWEAFTGRPLVNIRNAVHWNGET